jgi:hypothetical protein
MAVAFVALLVALGGTSYAVIRLPAHSVGAKQLKAGAVTRANLKNNAINGAKVANDSLTGADVVETSLGRVASATSAGGLDRVNYRTATGTVPPAPVGGTSVSAATGYCDSGQHVTGGAIKVDDPVMTAVVDSYPDVGGTAWTAHVDNGDEVAPHGYTVYAICAVSGAG